MVWEDFPPYGFMKELWSVMWGFPNPVAMEILKPNLERCECPSQKL